MQFDFDAWTAQLEVDDEENGKKGRSALSVPKNSNSSELKLPCAGGLDQEVPSDAL